MLCFYLPSLRRKEAGASFALPMGKHCPLRATHAKMSFKED
jgi:hypothetical protein